MRFPHLLLSALPLFALGQNDDIFNYEATSSNGRNYGPRDWSEVQCDDLDVCLGWPEKWDFGVGWSLSDNDCENCEPGDNCASHHQSPVPLQREWGYNKQVGDIGVLNCGDNHWMKYESGTCTWDHLVEKNAITVERHALRISQPIEEVEGNWELGCYTQGRGRIFSRLDMSGGFSQWWWLNHVEIHTPSEHTMDGQRFDGEIHLGHYYSVAAGTDNGSSNEMATIGIFLKAGDDIDPYPYLDKLICQWRKYEDKVREDCGFESVKEQYPGCMRLDRPGNPFVTNETTATERGNAKKKNIRRRKMVVDDEAPDEDMKMKLKVDPRNYRDAEWSEEQWADFQREYSRQHPLNSTNPFGSKRRHLVDYEHITHFNHQFMLDVRTEYYLRYKGSSTYPPCFGRGGDDNHLTNLWRFLKDPIRINTRQLKEMHRLLRERIGPADQIRNACVSDTAAKVEVDGTAWVARPLQELNTAHENFFCECEDWGSKVPEDKAWCNLPGDRTQAHRWFDIPYNYMTCEVGECLVYH